MKKVIIVDHLSYLNQLKNVSFTIQKGEIVGIIGGVNSGRDQIVRVVTGLLKPSSGFVSIIDYDPYLKNNDFLQKISYIKEIKKEKTSALSPIDILQITKDIYSLGDRQFNKNLDELTKYIKDPYLLNSLIYNPEVVVVENPNFETDPIYEYVNKNEFTALISSERVDNLVNLTRRIIILKEGEIIFDGAIEEVLNKYATEKIIKLKLTAEIDVKTVENLGVIKKYTHPYLQIAVPRETVNFICSELLLNLPAQNMEIAELSVEEIINNMKL
jgi:ABC-2 type transport system ATP-binding protein